jgi:hypothetical protein
MKLQLLEKLVIIDNNSLFLVNFLMRLKNKCMVIYVFCDVLGLINDLLDKGDFAHILKQQIDAMDGTWNPEHYRLPLH